MHKEIEKAVMRITSLLEKNRKAYEEADKSYRDTGYERYWKRMQSLEKEYEELKAFVFHEKKEESNKDTKLDELQREIRNLKRKWEYLRASIPMSADSVGIDDWFREMKHLIN